MNVRYFAIPAVVVIGLLGACGNDPTPVSTDGGEAAIMAEEREPGPPATTLKCGDTVPIPNADSGVVTTLMSPTVAGDLGPTSVTAEVEVTNNTGGPLSATHQPFLFLADESGIRSKHSRFNTGGFGPLILEPSETVLLPIETNLGPRDSFPNVYFGDFEACGSKRLASGEYLVFAQVDVSKITGDGEDAQYHPMAIFTEPITIRLP